MKILSGFLAVILLSVIANAQVVPILDLKSGGLIGGVKNGQFTNAETTFKGMKAEQEYGIIDLANGKSQDDLIIKISEPDVPCEDFYFISTELQTRTGIAVGNNASWNTLPRTVTNMSLNDKTYLNIVSGILKSKGLTRAIARIEQAVKIDLEGDGVDEVLIAANSYSENISPSAKIGDYSFVLLRKIVKGKVQNIMISEEYIKKNIDFGAPSQFEISAIADLNGDGKMEIVVYGEYYEGSGATVYEMKGNKPTNVLETGCGV